MKIRYNVVICTPSYCTHMYEKGRDSPLESPCHCAFSIYVKANSESQAVNRAMRKLAKRNVLLIGDWSCTAEII